MRFIDSYDVILLDLNGTFMFGQDRFGPDQDYFRTYRTVGGRRLEPGEVTALVTACHARILDLYHDPEWHDDFPGQDEVLRDFCGAPEDEIPILEQVLTAHELGRVPPAHAECIATLAQRHALGIVSNIWGRPDAWLRHLEEVKLRPVFSCIVFSSEGRSMKPSRKIFRRALEAFPPGSRILFVGDSHAHDVEPAKALGLGAVWISSASPPSRIADATIPSLLELPELRAVVGASTSART